MWRLEGKANPAVSPADESELLWVKSAQSTLSDLNILIKQFNLFMDDRGVWHCDGRLANAKLPYAVKLLPKDHPIASLIVKQAHERVLLNGVKETLTETRSKYWIPGGGASLGR